MPPEEIESGAEIFRKKLLKYGFDASDNKGNFENFCKYLSEYRAGRERSSDPCKYDFPERGLFLFGSRGTGKTHTMRFFSAIHRVDFVEASDFSIAYARHGAEGFWSLYDQFDGLPLIIDDIANEQDAKSYGNTIPMPELIAKRYELWKMGRVNTFFTSNVSGRNEFAERYGGTSLSRLLEMCDFWKYEGTDRRTIRKPHTAQNTAETEQDI